MKIQVGLIGLGVVGTGVVALLERNARLLQQRSGVEIVLRRVVDVDWQRARDITIEESKRSTDYREILSDPAIDIVVELVGGTTTAFDIQSQALAAKKHVVTANKALLCHRGHDLFQQALAHQRELRFEASVAGGIPIIKVIQESLVGDRVRTIYGIVNGTTNFILTRMIEDEWSFGDALRKAQQLGFAEADPTLDVNGSDAEHKLHVLANVAFGAMPSHESSYREGIEHVELMDVLYAKQLGYVIKLLAIAQLDNGAMSLRVHPTLVPEKCSLASVKNEYNAVLIESEFLGHALFVGRGAGSLPTATAVVGDIIDLAQGIQQGRSFSASRYMPSTNYTTLGSGDIRSRFYLRLATIERAGILAKITKLLGDEDISISAIQQKEGDEPIPIVILTRAAREENVRRAVAAIDKQDFTRGKTVVLHIEDIGL